MKIPKRGEEAAVVAGKAAIQALNAINRLIGAGRTNAEELKELREAAQVATNIAQKELDSLVPETEVSVPPPEDIVILDEPVQYPSEDDLTMIAGGRSMRPTRQDREPWKDWETETGSALRYLEACQEQGYLQGVRKPDRRAQLKPWIEQHLTLFENVPPVREVYRWIFEEPQAARETVEEPSRREPGRGIDSIFGRARSQNEPVGRRSVPLEELMNDPDLRLSPQKAERPNPPQMTENAQEEGVSEPEFLAELPKSEPPPKTGDTKPSRPTSFERGNSHTGAGNTPQRNPPPPVQPRPSLVKRVVSAILLVILIIIFLAELAVMVLLVPETSDWAQTFIIEQGRKILNTVQVTPDIPELEEGAPVPTTAPVVPTVAATQVRQASPEASPTPFPTATNTVVPTATFTPLEPTRTRTSLEAYVATQRAVTNPDS